jgi:superfamily II DNA or RNA helicase
MSVADLDKVLTSKGYAIKKSILSNQQVQELRSSLLMTPKLMDKFQKTENSTFPVYYESKTRYYVPRDWGIKHYGKPEADIVSDGKDLPGDTVFGNLKPHDAQETIIQNFLSVLNGIICVPCGMGKTYMAINIALRIRKRFLIVVDKEFLMNQWKAEIEKFTSNIRIGVLQAKKVEIDADKYDCTICMIQTLCKRDFPDGFFDEYGLTIFDECHHLGASYFSNALKKVQTKYMLGLSATPERSDSLEKVFEYYLGDYIFKQTQRAPDSEAVVKAIWFDSQDPKYKEAPTNWRGEIVTARLLNQIADYEPRKKRILDIIIEYIQDSNRNVLVLSDRISQLEWFHEELVKIDAKVGYYLGGMKQIKLDENADKCQVLLATYQMAAEGFSVKKLNTVIFATPRKRVEQSSGRIFRQRIEERQVAPHIIDIIDSHDCFVRRWYARRLFYKECQYTFQHIDKPKKVVEKVDANEHGCMIKI